MRKLQVVKQITTNPVAAAKLTKKVGGSGTEAIFLTEGFPVVGTTENLSLGNEGHQDSNDAKEGEKLLNCHSLS